MAPGKLDRDSLRVVVEGRLAARIAVAGATGNIGSRTVAALERNGHDIVRISRSLAVGLSTGNGLDDALAGVEAVVDVTNSPATDRAETAVHPGWIPIGSNQRAV